MNKITNKIKSFLNKVSSVKKLYWTLTELGYCATTPFGNYLIKCDSGIYKLSVDFNPVPLDFKIISISKDYFLFDEFETFEAALNFANKDYRYRVKRCLV